MAGSTASGEGEVVTRIPHTNNTVSIPGRLVHDSSKTTEVSSFRVIGLSRKALKSRKKEKKVFRMCCSGQG